jgi:EAL domain-containing protein (putative c-di-GMP-specific phosphodiesterase class I)
MEHIELSDDTAPAHPRPAPTEDGSRLVIDGLPGHFCLHYQPEIDLSTRSIVACEAFLRWWHPTFGMLRPGPSLEGTRWSGDLATLEEWAVRAAHRQSATWASSGTPIRVAVNVTVPRLGDPGFVEVVDSLAGSFEADAPLALDVPFGAFLRHRPATMRATDRLREVGVVVIADGAFGCEAVESLRHTAVSMVKIPLHTSGPRHPGLHPLVAATLASANDLDLVATAKQVEDAMELDHLQLLGFDRAFGNAVSHPVTAEAFTSIIGRQGARSATS